MDMAPYARINPCGYQGLEMAQTSQLSDDPRADTLAALEPLIVEHLAEQLNYSGVVYAEDSVDDLLEYWSDARVAAAKANEI
jgi:lipoyl(octanoyl) transferase